MKYSVRPYIELALGMILAGSSVVVGKLILSSFPVFLASGLRFAVSSIVLIPLLLLKEKGSLLKISRKDWFVLALQSFFGVFLFSIFLLYGLKQTSGVESGIILSTIPAIIGLISFIFLKEPLTSKKGLGILFSVLGIMSINLIGVNSDGMNHLAGNLLVFGAVAAEALFTILSKTLSKTVTPLMITTTVSFFGLMMFLPFSIYEAAKIDFFQIVFTDWLLILYYGIFVTVISFLFWFQGVSKVKGSTAGVFSGILPVSAVLLSYIILNEPFSWIHLLGITFVLAGILLIIKDGE